MAAASEVPHKVKVTGWVCLGIGAFFVLTNGVVLLMDAVSPLPRGTTPIIAFAHRPQMLIVNLALAICLALAGWALSRGSNPGRLGVMVIAGLWALVGAPVAGRLIVMPGALIAAGFMAHSYASIVAFIFGGLMLLLLVVVLGAQAVGFYFAYRWLTSPLVVQACHARSTAPAAGA